MKSSTNQAKQAIEAGKQTKLQHEKKADEVEDKIKNSVLDKGDQESKNLEIYDKEVEYKQKIKDLQKEQYECRNKKDEIKKLIAEHDDKLTRGMPNGSSKALRFLDAYVKREKVQGYYGPLIDLIQCNEKYYTAVEQTGGRQMFSCVVEDENVASRLVKAMQTAQGQAGRMSFMPLNKLRPNKTNFPQGLMDAEPLAKCIKCEDKFRVAVDQVFGSTLLCRTLEVANQYRQEHNLECVTMDGDKVQKRGAIKGGYYDTSSSKLKLNQAKREKAKETIVLDKKEAEIQEKLNRCQQQEQDLMTEKWNSDKSRETADREKRNLNNTLEKLRYDIKCLTQEISDKEKQIEDNTGTETELTHKTNTLRDQLAQPFAQSITDEQMQRLSELTTKHTELTRSQTDQEKAKNKLERQKSMKEEELQRGVSDLQELKDSIAALQGNSASMNGTLMMEQRKLQELGNQKKVRLIRI